KRQTVIYQLLLEIHRRAPDKIGTRFTRRNLAFEPFIGPCTVIVGVDELDERISMMEGRKEIAHGAVGVYNTVNDEFFFLLCRCDDISIRVAIAGCVSAAQASRQKQQRKCTTTPQSAPPL